MAEKYGYTCPQCKETVLDGNKTVVAQFKKGHKARGCDLIKTKRATFARPGLAGRIDAEIACRGRVQ